MTDEDKDKLINTVEHIAQYGTAPPESINLIDVGTGKYLEYFKREIIDDLISGGGSTCKFYEGTYGSGKSHLLRLLKECALKNRMLVTEVELSQALKISDWKMITEYILENMEVIIDKKKIRSLPSILKTIGPQCSGNDVKELGKAQLPSPGFKNAMLYALHGNDYNEFQWGVLNNFLTGKRVTMATLKSQGFNGVKGYLTGRNAEIVLKSVLSGLYKLGFKGNMLLFDENEATLGGRPMSKSNTAAANLLRRMIDSCFNGTLIGTVAVFAVLPDFLMYCSDNYPALGQRLSKNDVGIQSWRWPVIRIDSVNEIPEQENFLKALIDKFMQIAEQLDIRGYDVKKEMMQRGEKALSSNAGSGYKRAITKAIAYVICERL